MAREEKQFPCSNSKRLPMKIPLSETFIFRLPFHPGLESLSWIVLLKFRILARLEFKPPFSRNFKVCQWKDEWSWSRRRGRRRTFDPAKKENFLWRSELKDPSQNHFLFEPKKRRRRSKICKKTLLHFLHNFATNFASLLVHLYLSPSKIWMLPPERIREKRRRRRQQLIPPCLD